MTRVIFHWSNSERARVIVMSWDQLLSIILANEQIQQEQAARPIVDCRKCGKTLSTGPAGEQFCTGDGWQPGLGGLLGALDTN